MTDQTNSPDPTSSSQPAEEQAEQLVSPTDQEQAELPPEPEEQPADQARWQVWLWRAGKVILAVIIIFLLLAVGLYLKLKGPVSQIKQSVLSLQSVQQPLKQALKDQDLTAIKSNLATAESAMADYNQAVSQLSWLSGLPYVGNYWQDGYHLGQAGTALLQAADIGVEAVTPYADFLGLKVGDEPGEKQTAMDRVEFLVQTLDKVKPQLESIGQQLDQADQHLGQISIDRYPAEFQGYPVQQYLTQLQQATKQGKVLLTDARPMLEAAPYMFGIDEPRTYLVLFQNDAELRPTGGFWTAYAILKMDKGKVTPLFSSDIYELDNKFNSRIPAPDPILRFLPKVDVWNLRDMNLSPDFKVSVETFLQHYEKTGSPMPDGVIAVDTKLLVDLLRVIGPIGVSGYGNFSAEEVPECNCPQVFYALESMISYETPYIRENRKAVLGPLMQAVLANALGQPKEKMSELVKVGLQSVAQKHILFYFRKSEVQQAVEAFNAAGRVRDYPGDYLMVVDTNFAGAKANMYVESEWQLEVVPQSDGWLHKLTLTYRNPQPHDGWLNGDYPDWVRVFVPAGARLMKGEGGEIEFEVGEELGKTVFSTFFVLRPQGLAKIYLEYLTPVSDSQSLLIQKQGGTKNYLVNLVLPDSQAQEFYLDRDQEFSW